MNCDEFKQLIGDYLDDEVAEELCEEVKAHLRACGSCSFEVDTLKKTIVIYRHMSKPPHLTPDAKKRLYAILSYEYRNGGRLAAS